MGQDGESIERAGGRGRSVVVLYKLWGCVRNDRLAFEMVGPRSKTTGLCSVTAASKGEVLWTEVDCPVHQASRQDGRA